MAAPRVNWLNRDLIKGPYLCLVKTKTEWDAAFKQLKVAPEHFPESHGRCVTFAGPTGELCAVVLIQCGDTRTSIEIAGLIVHEAVHVVQAYFRHIGEMAPGEEIQAYSTQIVAQRLMAQWCGEKHA